MVITTRSVVDHKTNVGIVALVVVVERVEDKTHTSPVVIRAVHWSNNTLLYSVPYSLKTHECIRKI